MCHYSLLITFSLYIIYNITAIIIMFNGRMQDLCILDWVLPKLKVLGYVYTMYISPILNLSCLLDLSLVNSTWARLRSFASCIDHLLEPIYIFEIDFTEALLCFRKHVSLERGLILFEETLNSLSFLTAKIDFNYLHDLHPKSNKFWIISSKNAASSLNLVS